MTPTFPPLTIALTKTQADDALIRTLKAVQPGEVFTAAQFTNLVNRYLELTHPGCNPLDYSRTYPWLQKMVDTKVLEPRKYPVNGTVHTAWSRKADADWVPSYIHPPTTEIDVEDLDEAVEIRNQTILDLNQRIVGMLQAMGLQVAPETLMNPVEATQKFVANQGWPTGPVHAAHEDLTAIRRTLGLPDGGSREDLLRAVASMKDQLDVYLHNEAAGDEAEECRPDAPEPQGPEQIMEILSVKAATEIIPAINTLLAFKEAYCAAKELLNTLNVEPSSHDLSVTVQNLVNTITKDHEVFTEIRKILELPELKPITEACRDLKAAIDTNDAVFSELINLLGTTSILEGVKALKSQQQGYATAVSIVQSLCEAAQIPDEGSHVANYMAIQRRLIAAPEDPKAGLPLTHMYKAADGTIIGCLYGEMVQVEPTSLDNDALYVALNTDQPLHALLYKLYNRLIAVKGLYPATVNIPSRISIKRTDKAVGATCFKDFDFEATGFDYIVYHAPVGTEQDPGNPMAPITLKTRELLVAVAWNNNSLPKDMAPVGTHFTPAIVNAPDMITLTESDSDNF